MEYDRTGFARSRGPEYWPPRIWTAEFLDSGRLRPGYAALEVRNGGTTDQHVDRFGSLKHNILWMIKKQLTEKPFPVAYSP